ncbi:MAG: HlyD family efflux transporter periplasmic adaptor subunit [Steroidobacteraceae bacterium]|nr:HlyD family efflux transporter periplasmic adaptor subunit [Steroidobacteraceae bacterium]
MMHGNRALVVVAALALTACGGDGDALLGTLERDRVELVAEAQEPIVEVAVHEGDAVTEGQLLLRLDPAAVEARLAQARAAMKQAERRQAELVAGARREQVREARALAEGAASKATAAAGEFRRIEKLVADGMLPASELDRQRGLRDGTAADERAAKERLAELERGTRSEVVEQAAAALAGARAQVAELELSLARHMVSAPRAGIVDALPYELGERPPRGAPIAVLLAAGQPYARVFIPEPMRASVKAGSPANVRIDGTDHDWRGELRYVSSEAAFTPYYALNERDRSRLSFLAEVVLTEPEAAGLPTGMPVEVTMLEDRASP